MKVNLKKAKEKEKENLILVMVIIMKEILLMINLMDKDILNLKMGENTKEIGKIMK